MEENESKQEPAEQPGDEASEEVSQDAASAQSPENTETQAAASEEDPESGKEASSGGETSTGKISSPEEEPAAEEEEESAEAEKETAESDPPLNRPDPSVGTGSAVPRASQEEAPRIGRILDLELPVSVSFGSARRPLSDVLELKTGMVLELDTEAEDGAVLKVNQKTFARGEIVEVAGHYGLRITEIESKSQRLSALEGNG